MIIFAILAVAIILWIVLYNSIISSVNTIKEANGGIDAVKQNLYDLIPNIIEVVKQYTKQEKEVFTKVTELRTQFLSNKWELTIDGENQMNSLLKNVFAISENYPELKSNQNFITLQNQWYELEDTLQATRRNYNSAVNNLNNKKQQFPTNIIAWMMTIPEYNTFQASEMAQKGVNAKELFNNI